MVSEPGKTLTLKFTIFLSSTIASKGAATL